MARKLARKAVTPKPTPEQDARNRKKPAAKKKRRKRKKATRVYSVELHKREPELVRSLVVIDVGDPLWTDADDNDVPIVHAYPDIEDGIVWIIPPHDASELAIERVNQACKNDGAHIIKLLPRVSISIMVPEQEHFDFDGPPQTSRELVMEIADASNSTQIKAVKKLLNEVLGEEGL